MSFLVQEPTTFVNIKLTDTGRRLLSLGQLTYKKAVFSDREIDYSIDRSGQYSILLNRVMAPKDDQPRLPPFHFDGTPATPLLSQLLGGVHSVTATCQSMGFYSGGTSVTGDTIPSVNDYVISGTQRLGLGNTNAGNFDGTNVAAITSSSYSPGPGNLAFVVFSNPSGGGDAAITSDAPFVALWYRITGSTSSVTADRNFPDFSTAGSSESSRMHHYPWNGIMEYYGSGSSMDTKVWNLNIVRSSSEIGTALGDSGYTTYGSTDYNGQKHFLGFDDHYRQIGFLHYTNEYTGNTYGEQLVPGSVEVDMPHLLWHRNAAVAGEGEHAGQRFTDNNSPVFYDPIAGTTYTLLMDAPQSGFTVGRVYPNLKLIAITDPELLTALSYKSNRNWTLPPLNLNYRSTPRAGLTINDVSGCLVDGKTYYVTYLPAMDNQWAANTSFGYQPALHCGYIQKISGYTDSDGYSPYLSARFSAPAFPYLRSDVGMTTYSGTGWNANSMAILIKEIDTDADLGVDHVGSDGWKLIGTGGGYYVGGEDGGNTINPSYALLNEFIVDQSDVDSATTYTLDTAFTERIDYQASGNTLDMTFGNEAFFYGNVKASLMRTTYTTVITLQAQNSEFNSSLNPTFYTGVDTNTYFTEIGILDDDDRLVAVGKLTKPTLKNDTLYLIIQLHLDF
jgi:hypothetical protein